MDNTLKDTTCKKCKRETNTFFFKEFEKRRCVRCFKEPFVGYGQQRTSFKI